MPGFNPYKASPGSETDKAIHDHFFGSSVSSLPYSVDPHAAEKVRSRIKSIYGYPVRVGETRTKPRQYFARFESGPSTSTEALADTPALAICRLALVIATKRDPTAQ